MKIKPINRCRACGYENLSDIISLGNHYVSNFIKSVEEQGEKIPLELVLCNQCKLLQLKYSAPDELMWNEMYWYKSTINKIIRNDLKDIVEKSEKLVNLNDEDIVIDIGANDCELFTNFKNKNLKLVGFEPCKNVAMEGKAKGFNVIQDFFNADAFKMRFKKKAKLITAISMFYDLENPNKFLEDVKECLANDGLFVIQQNYLASMLENNAFDNCVFEHRSYYSLYSLKSLLEKHGLEIFDIELNEINGGSIRAYIKFKDYESSKFMVDGENRILNLEKKEKEMQLDTLKPYQEFAKRIDSIKKQVMDFLKQEKAKGKVIGICGASTRGNTTLQYFGITPDLVIGCAEANPDKFGKKTVGTLLPIMSIDEMKELNPDYQLVLIWHLFAGLMDKEKEFLQKGGKFILPLPKFKIVEK